MCSCEGMLVRQRLLGMFQGLGVYVQLVWELVVCKKKALKLEVMKSEIHLRHTTHQNSNMPDLGHIIGLLD